MRFRYFDPLQQLLVEGDLVDGTQVPDLVGRVSGLRADCSPALEFAGTDGSSMVLGVAHDRAVVLWTTPDGTTRHSLGPSDGTRPMFDYFGAYTQMPGHYAVPLAEAVVAAGEYVDGAVPSTPALLLALD